MTRSTPVFRLQTPTVQVSSQQTQTTSRRAARTRDLCFPFSSQEAGKCSKQRQNVCPIAPSAPQNMSSDRQKRPSFSTRRRSAEHRLPSCWLLRVENIWAQLVTPVWIGSDVRWPCFTDICLFAFRRCGDRNDAAVSRLWEITHNDNKERRERTPRTPSARRAVGESTQASSGVAVGGGRGV